MKSHRLLSAATAAMMLSISAISLAQTVNFTTCGATGATGPSQGDCDAAYGPGQVTVIGGIQNWTVPATGLYRITATGAAGAPAGGAVDGGGGARLSSEFNLTAGNTLQIVVGQRGQVGRDDEKSRAGTQNGPDTPQSIGEERNGGGGGGSFVVTAADSPMVIAGGGGGTRYESLEDGCDASASQYATTGSGNQQDFGDGPRCPVKTTDLGLGGEALQWFDYGSAGAGFNGDGEADLCGPGGGGRSWANGMTGGHVYEADGGFGGGGSGEGCSGGGGGGGYSGGDGGHIAGGGGSYVSGSNPTALIGVSTGDGDVSIELLVEERESRATFHVIKAFIVDTDSHEDGVDFVVVDFDDGELDCVVTETPVPGYDTSYTNRSLGNVNRDDGCFYNDVEFEADHSCVVVNALQQVRVDVRKIWFDDHPEFNNPMHARGRWNCYSGQYYRDADNPEHYGCDGDVCGSLSFYGPDDTDSFYVYPDWDGSTWCSVEEKVFESGVESNASNCAVLFVSPGQGNACTITNTRFYQGIPTLSQYGLAILALLMLGVGLVGFRRFV
jgi:hypothetical protein